MLQDTNFIQLSEEDTTHISSAPQQEEVSLEEEFLSSSSFKVIVRLEFSSSLPSEKVILKLKPNTSYQTLVQELFNVFHQIPSSSYFQIKYFDEDAESEVCIRNDEQVSCFLEQYKDPNVLKEHKQLVFCIFHQAATTTTTTTLRPNVVRATPAFITIPHDPTQSQTTSVMITSQNLEMVKTEFFRKGCVSLNQMTTPQEHRQQQEGRSRAGATYDMVELLCVFSRGDSSTSTSNARQQKRRGKLLKFQNSATANQLLKDVETLRNQLSQYHPQQNASPIVRIRNAVPVGGEDSRLVVIEMEYLKHNLWNKVIQKRIIWPEKMIFDIVKQTCQALEFLDQQCIQREINTYNIYLRSFDIQNETVEIAIVPKINSTICPDCLEEYHSIREKQSYQAPEMLIPLEQSENRIESCTFALGVVLYQILTFDTETSWPTLVQELNSASTIQEYIKSRTKIPYSDSLLNLVSGMIAHERPSIPQLLELVSNITSTQNADVYFEIANQCMSVKDYSNAKRYFNKSAQHGNVGALLKLGMMYEKGTGVAQNFKTAMELFKQAADQGNAKAQFKVGTCYENGHGSEHGIDYRMAKKYYLKAAQQNYVKAQLNLGLLYWQNKLKSRTRKDKAYYWFKAAREHPYAQYNLGGMFYRDQYYSKAVKCFLRSAKQGCKEAQNNLGLMYLNGTGVKKDFTQAFEWLEKAAHQGCPTAQFNLGLLYEKGDGVQQDLKQANEWYQKAAQHNNAQHLPYGDDMLHGLANTVKTSLLRGFNTVRNWCFSCLEVRDI
ncbi:hypothetical protein C9374_012861 [Naegleria lovaniensis]|uniref:Protein kinase domain-containing protein n=1 Tax=Naegleria lovaniensis TaxID=51637 RepID=A0AA88KDP8_NAELO|nr:uncharacterized protein C9374_012861 [Naegleria lovaniensis]KAG2373129.1 hypothetical protein C9374_012861 [Naegleria lovaniensis]